MRCNLLFTGDIMSQIPQNEACRTGDGYDYRPVFAPVQTRLDACDYLVGNLETPLCGEDMHYSEALYSFNTPREFAQALADAGFDLVSTANNHCLDRQLTGLRRTLDTLDAIGLDHIGTYNSPQARQTPFIAWIQGICVGFLAYTYGTNAFAHHYYLPEDAHWAVNLFMPEELRDGAINLLADTAEIDRRVRTLYDAPNPVYDAHIAPQLAQLARDAAATRAAGADYIVLLMHSGGQYNPLPDPYTRRLVERIGQMDIDAIIGNHPHVIHPLSWQNGRPVAYSLGNFTYTPGYSPPREGENPLYSMLFRLTLEKTPEGTRPVGAECSLLQSTLTDGGLSVVTPVDTLIQSAADPGPLLADYRRFLLKFGGIEDAPVAAWHALPVGG